MPPPRATDPDVHRLFLKAVGTVVRRRREAVGMTQERLEAASAVHVTHVRAIEAGRRNASGLVLWQLAQGLGVSYGTFSTEVEAEVGASREG
ncbi:helix-turn-helix domain-containing protein [Rubricoccus marinus]|uniref:HTH cro/C1-type domain-containing protein n=1 Tax=Rubricoccus marinus TaxID=716817 RepID=A0A259TU97_9BACT|nr:helix-turn-helix transcriptional regulator [Rubricoccus marinus]OZC01266.1 hypothetical protein BSZ36_17620 [Rubricoccus marinus]